MLQLLGRPAQRLVRSALLVSSPSPFSCTPHGRSAPSQTASVMGRGRCRRSNTRTRNRCGVMVNSGAVGANARVHQRCVQSVTSSAPGEQQYGLTMGLSGRRCLKRTMPKTASRVPTHQVLRLIGGGLSPLRSASQLGLHQNPS